MQVDIKKIENQLLSVKKFALGIAEDEKAPLAWRESAIQSYMELKSSVDNYKSNQFIFTQNARNNRLIKYTSINEFKRKHEGKSILSIGFGPSLTEEIEKVKRLADKMPVICSDTAFSWLVSKKIMPRYVCCLDAKTDKKHVPKDIDLSGVTLFANIGASSDYIYECSIRGMEIVFFTCECRIRSHLELATISGVNECLPVSGNVSFGQDYIALSVMNCKKLYIAGHDYCFNRMYYPEKEYSRNIEKEVAEKRIFPVYEQNGDVAYTDRSLLFYREFFKRYLHEQNYMDRVYNVSDYGLCNFTRRMK